ncbi:hypothetical protein RSAG8_02535, partial [Rhizoctonia solani AG-8 WAC10335]
MIERRPRRPFKSARLDAELKLAGENRLRSERRIWRNSLVLYKIRRPTQALLKLETKDPQASLRRLQTQVFKSGLAKSIHHAHVLIHQRHIRVGKQIVNVPSFALRLDSQKHIDFALTSPYGGGRKGRVHRKRAAAAANKDAGGDEEDE